MRRTKEKVIALTLAASSIISTIPANAAQFVEDSDAQIKNAIAYKDGKYLYEGYKGESDYGVYYNDGINDIKLEDVDDLDEYAKFKTNYVTVPDGNGEQSINLEDGQVSEDISKEVSKDEAQSRLESKLKRSKKYGNDFELVEFNEIENNIASDEQWYSYVAKGNRNYDTSEDEIVEEEYATKMKVRLNALFCDIKIAGVTFSPKWGANGADSEDLADRLKRIKLNDGYSICDIRLLNDNRTVEFTLTTNEVLTEIPEGLIVFSDKGVETDITKLGSEGWMGNISITNDDSIIVPPSNNIPGIPGNPDNKPEGEIEWRTEITFSIEQFWGMLTVNGVNIETGNVENTVNNINKANLGTDYEIYAKSSDDGNKVIAVLKTKLDINTINEIPKDLIKFAGSNVEIAEDYGLLHDISWAVRISNSDIKNNSKNDEIVSPPNDQPNTPDQNVAEGTKYRYLIDSWHDTDINIDGQKIAGKTGSMSEVIKAISDELQNLTFDKFIVISCSENAGKIEIVIQNKEKNDTLGAPKVICSNQYNTTGWEISGEEVKSNNNTNQTAEGTKYKYLINSWHDTDINIDGQKIVGKTGSMAEVIKAINDELQNLTFDKFIVISCSENSGQIEIVIQNKEKNDTSGAPKVTCSNQYNTAGWKINAEEVKSDSNAAQTAEGAKFRYLINAWYGTNVTIDGQMISEKTGNITEVVEQFKKELDGMTFGNFVVLSCSESSGNLEIIVQKIKKDDNEAPKVVCSNQNNTTGWDIPAEEVKKSIAAKSNYSDLSLQDVESEDDNDDDSDDEKVLYFGFTDGKGNYIDCTKVANISVFNGYNFLKLKEFNSSKDSKDIEVSLGLPSLIRTIGQDNDYIYCVISVPVKNYQPATGDYEFNKGAVSDLKYIQKISKAKRDSTDGGAYIPRSVNSYQIYADSSDWNYYHIDNLFGDKDNEVKTLIIDGKIYYVKESSEDGEDKVVYGKVILKGSEKVTLVNLDGEETKVSFPLVKHDGSAEVEAEDWDIDFEGSVWAINSGEVLKSRQATDFQTIYECDNSFDRISVYNNNNFIVWNEDTAGYATYLESEKAQEQVKLTGWNKLSDGIWHLYDVQGNETKGWTNYNSCWYYFNNDGIMQTGWIEDNGQKYYLSHSGVMQRGWIKIEDKWYYLDQSGVMKYSTAIDGYNLDENGVWIQ